MHRRSLLLLLAPFALVLPGSLVRGQTSAPGKHVLIPFKNRPALTPGELELVKLESQFQDAVSKGGGAAFASWFAEDGVTLNNGQPAVLGRQAIAGVANWDPKAYQLTWYVEGAQMGPSGDTGFTWGHYDAHVTSGVTPKALSGRYITFWKKLHGTWKVALDASANDAPAP
jgi:ketosteroid isomerase-like protein